METIKKMALVLTAIITAATALTACGGSSDNGSTADAGATTTAAASADESKAEEKKEDESKAEEKKEEESKADESKADESKADEKPAASADKPAKKAKSVVAKKQEEAPEPPVEPVEQSSILVDAFANTVWVGMDSDYNCYALFLGDEEISFMADDGSEINGYWGVADGDPNIYIFSDAELTDCIFTMPFTADVENNVLVINDTIVLAPTEATDAGAMAEEMEKTATACKVAAYLDGTYWAGADESAVIALSLEGSEFEFYQISAEGEEIAVQCYWSMDPTGLTLYTADEEGALHAVMTMGITIAADGSALEVAIPTADGDVQTAVLNQVSEADATDIVSYLHSLLEGGAEGGEEAAEGEEEYAEEETEEEETEEEE